MFVILASCASPTSGYNNGGTLSDLQQPRYGYELLDLFLPF